MLRRALNQPILRRVATASTRFTANNRTIQFATNRSRLFTQPLQTRTYVHQSMRKDDWAFLGFSTMMVTARAAWVAGKFTVAFLIMREIYRRALTTSKENEDSWRLTVSNSHSMLMDASTTCKDALVVKCIRYRFTLSALWSNDSGLWDSTEPQNGTRGRFATRCRWCSVWKGLCAFRNHVYIYIIWCCLTTSWYSYDRFKPNKIGLYI